VAYLGEGCVAGTDAAALSPPVRFQMGRCIEHRIGRGTDVRVNPSKIA
jgi:hypothetical protein